MGVQLKNNAESTITTAISNTDIGLSVASGTGALFSAAGGSNYFYLTIQGTNNAYEIVKVTARSGDSMTIVRAQEGTSAQSFSAGSRVEQRITSQTLVDKFAENNLSANSVTLGSLATIGAGKVLGSVLGGNVSELSITNVLDLVGSTQGQVLFRGAGGWSVLSPGTSGQVLKTNGAAADPAWVSAALLASANTFTANQAITLNQSATTKLTVTNTQANASAEAKIELVSDAGTGYITQFATENGILPGAMVINAPGTLVINSVSDVSLARNGTLAFTVGASGITNFAVSPTFSSASGTRTNLGLGTIATQAATAVAITGGTATGLTSLQGTGKLATNTTGTLALVDADCINPMTGNITINGGVFSNPQMFLFYAGASSRTITQGSSMTLRLGGTSTTGSRTLAAYTLAAGYVVDTNTVVISGNGVT